MIHSDTESEAPNQILVWDLPTRIFHWLLAICFAGAMITQDMERLRLVHNTFGYTMLGLVGFRLIWGFIGTRYARFSSFVPHTQQVVAYLAGLMRGKPSHVIGHNPLGALGIVAMLALTVGAAGSGVLLDQGIAEELFEEIHEMLANLLFVVVGIHVAGVMVSSRVNKENLILAMVNGYKRGKISQGIQSSIWWLGLLLTIGVVGFWLSQFGVI